MESQTEMYFPIQVAPMTYSSIQYDMDYYRTPTDKPPSKRTKVTNGYIPRDTNHSCTSSSAAADHIQSLPATNEGTLVQPSHDADQYLSVDSTLPMPEGLSFATLNSSESDQDDSDQEPEDPEGEIFRPEPS